MAYTHVSGKARRSSLGTQEDLVSESSALAQIPASDASFQELLLLLSAKHDHLRAENEALRKDTTRLLGKEPAWVQAVARPSGSRPDPGADVTSADEQEVLRCERETSSESALDDGSETNVKRASMTAMPSYHQLPGVSSALGDTSAEPFPLPEIRDLWQATITSGSSKPSMSALVLHTGQTLTSMADSSIPGRFCSRLVMAPESSRRMMWDLMGMLLLIFDILHTPLMVFYDSSSDFELIMAAVTTVFWTLDIGVAFLRGYYSSCILEMRPRVIAARYLRREFLPDIVICSFDWTMMVIQTGAHSVVSYSRLSKAIRIIRIARILRLLRLVKMHAFFEMLESSSLDFTTLSLIHVSKNLVIICVVNHFIACGWYAVGGLDVPSWRDRLEKENRSVPYRYVTALHWSITQFTPASMEIQPCNAYERLFAICVIFIGLVMFSSFVSTITSTMTTFRVERQKRFKQREYIRRYISENSISLAVGSRISAFLSSYKFGSPKRVARNEILLFKALPKNLRLMIDWEVYHRILTRVEFFSHCEEMCSHALLEVCHGAVDEVSIGSCEELFHCGESAWAMHITIVGSMQYYLGYDERNPEDIHGRSNIRISEHALWLAWTHQGRIFSLTQCDLVSIRPKKLAKALVHHPDVLFACREYARLYHLRMRQDNWDILRYKSNVVSMASSKQSVFSRQVVEQDDDSWRPPSSDLFRLNNTVALELAQSAFSEAINGCEVSQASRLMRTLSRGNSNKSSPVESV